MQNIANNKNKKMDNQGNPEFAVENSTRKLIENAEIIIDDNLEFLQHENQPQSEVLT